jgi:agmatine deiminase
MALQRNPGKTIPEIEKELKKVTGARKIIWLKDGLAEDRIYKNYGPFYKKYFGGGANMHIDELCRFTDPGTVILPFITESDARKSPVDSINFAMLEENLAILRASTGADGKKLRIIRFPMPEPETLKYTQVTDSSNLWEMRNWGFSTGDSIYRIPAASYMNFFVSNNVVLIPRYWVPGMPVSQLEKDDMARQLFVQLFPDREVVQIYALTVNRGGGGIHCMTHEQPVGRE